VRRDKNEEESNIEGTCIMGALITGSKQSVPFLTPVHNLSAYKSYRFTAANRMAK
jgi:hypothetical protein